MVPVQTSDPQTSDVTKVGQYKRRTQYHRTLQRSDSTNVGRYKGRPVKTSDLQTSDWYKCKTDTNVGLVQTSDGYISKVKRRTFVSLKKKTIAIRNKLKVTHFL